MDKQSTLAFVLMGLVLVVWLYLNSPEPQPQNISKTDSTLVQEKNKQEAQKEGWDFKTQEKDKKDYREDKKNQGSQKSQGEENYKEKA